MLVVYSMERCSDFQDLFEHIMHFWIIKNNVSTLRSLTLITFAKYLCMQENYSRFQGLRHGHL